jgi:hypothetical protein
MEQSSDTKPASGNPPERSKSDKRAIVEAYDAADFRGRYTLLDSEGISIRDIARWRRETAPATTSSAPPKPVRRTAQRPPTKRAAKSRGRNASVPAEVLDGKRGIAAHTSALHYHVAQLRSLLPDTLIGEDAQQATVALDRLIAALEQLDSAVTEFGRQQLPDELPEARDPEAIAAELQDMLAGLSDYPSLAVALQILARDLAGAAPDAARPTGSRVTDRGRRPWWGDETD